MDESSSNLLQSPLSHILCLTPCLKARKSFHCVLPCLVMMYHQTSLGCQSICKELVEICGRLWLWPWPWPWIQQSNSSLWTCTVKPSLWPWIQQGTNHTTLQLMNMHCWLPQKSAVRNIEIVISSSLYEPKFSYCDFTLKIETHFSQMTGLKWCLSTYWVWLQLVQWCIMYHPN